jgi:hypothetical protein
LDVEDAFPILGKARRDCAGLVVGIVLRVHPYSYAMVAGIDLYRIGLVTFDTFEDDHVLLYLSLQRTCIRKFVINPNKNVGCRKMVFNADL